MQRLKLTCFPSAGPPPTNPSVCDRFSPELYWHFRGSTSGKATFKLDFTSTLVAPFWPLETQDTWLWNLQLRALRQDLGSVIGMSAYFFLVSIYLQKDTQSGLLPFRECTGGSTLLQSSQHTLRSQTLAQPFLCLAKQATSSVRQRTLAYLRFVLINDSAFCAKAKT